MKITILSDHPYLLSKEKEVPDYLIPFLCLNIFQIHSIFFYLKDWPNYSYGLVHSSDSLASPTPPFFCGIFWTVKDSDWSALMGSELNLNWTKSIEIMWGRWRWSTFELTLAMCKFCFALSWEALFPVSHPSDRLLTSAVYLEAPTPESDSSFFSNLSVPLSRSRPLLVLERGRRFLN